MFAWRDLLCRVERNTIELRPYRAPRPMRELYAFGPQPSRLADTVGASRRTTTLGRSRSVMFNRNAL
jgi:hypothetical protein